MKYYKYDNEETGIDGAVTYIETEDGVHIRQITSNGIEVIASNVMQPNGQMDLAEGSIDYEEILDEVTAISKDEFDHVWNAWLSTRETQWQQTKQAHPVGQAVEGLIVLFYPQGVIVNLGNQVLGVADYTACRSSTEPKNMYPRHKVTAVVENYDEVNQWVVLGSPQVY
jgi:hypothetical protein